MFVSLKKALKRKVNPINKHFGIDLRRGKRIEVIYDSRKVNLYQVSGVRIGNMIAIDPLSKEFDWNIVPKIHMTARNSGFYGKILKARRVKLTWKGRPEGGKMEFDRSGGGS